MLNMNNTNDKQDADYDNDNNDKDNNDSDDDAEHNDNDNDDGNDMKTQDHINADNEVLKLAANVLKGSITKIANTQALASEGKLDNTDDDNNTNIVQSQLKSSASRNENDDNRDRHKDTKQQDMQHEMLDAEQDCKTLNIVKTSSKGQELKSNAAVTANMNKIKSKNKTQSSSRSSSNSLSTHTSSGSSSSSGSNSNSSSNSNNSNTSSSDGSSSNSSSNKKNNSNKNKSSENNNYTSINTKTAVSKNNNCKNSKNKNMQQNNIDCVKRTNSKCLNLNLTLDSSSCDDDTQLTLQRRQDQNDNKAMNEEQRKVEAAYARLTGTAEQSADTQELLQKLSINNPFYRFRKQSTSLKELRRLRRKRLRKFRSETDLLNYQQRSQVCARNGQQLADNVNVVVVLDSKYSISKRKSLSNLDVPSNGARSYISHETENRLHCLSSYASDNHDDTSTVITNPFSIFHDDDILTLSVNTHLRATSSTIQRPAASAKKHHRSERSLRRFFDLDQQKRQYMLEHQHIYGLPVSHFERQDFINSKDNTLQKQGSKKSKLVFKHLSLRKLHKSSTSTALLASKDPNALPQLKKLKISYPNRTQSIHSIRAYESNTNSFQSKTLVTSAAVPAHKHSYFERLQAKTKHGLQKIREKCRTFKQQAIREEHAFNPLSKDDSFRFISDRAHINNYETHCAAAAAACAMGKQATIYKSYKSEFDLSKNLHYLDAYLEENFDQHLRDSKKCAYSVGRVSGTRLARQRDIMQKQQQQHIRQEKSPRSKTHKRSLSANKAMMTQNTNSNAHKQHLDNYENLSTLPITQERRNVRKVYSDSLSSSDYASVFSGPTVKVNIDEPAPPAIATNSTNANSNTATTEEESAANLRYEHPKMSQYTFNNMTTYALELADTEHTLLAPNSAKETDFFFPSDITDDDEDEETDYAQSAGKLDEGIRILISASESDTRITEGCDDVGVEADWYQLQRQQRQHQLNSNDKSNFVAYNENLAESNFYRSLNQHLKQQIDASNADHAAALAAAAGKESKDLKYESYLEHFQRHKKKSNSIEYDNACERDYSDSLERLRQDAMLDAETLTPHNLHSTRNELPYYNKHDNNAGSGSGSRTNELLVFGYGDGGLSNCLATLQRHNVNVTADDDDLIRMAHNDDKLKLLATSPSNFLTGEAFSRQPYSYSGNNQQQHQQNYTKQLPAMQLAMRKSTTQMAASVDSGGCFDATNNVSAAAGIGKASRYIYENNDDDISAGIDGNVVIVVDDNVTSTITTSTLTDEAATLSPANIYTSKEKNISTKLTINEPANVAAATVITPYMPQTTASLLGGGVMFNESKHHGKSANIVATANAAATTNNRYILENLRKYYQQQQQQQQPTGNSVNSSSLSTSSSSTSSMSQQITHQQQQQQHCKLPLTINTTAQYKQHQQQQQYNVSNYYARRNSTISNTSSSDTFDTFIALRNVGTPQTPSEVKTMAAAAATGNTTAAKQLQADYKNASKRVTTTAALPTTNASTAYQQQQQHKGPQQQYNNITHACNNTSTNNTGSAITPTVPLITALNYYGIGAAGAAASCSSNSSSSNSSASNSHLTNTSNFSNAASGISSMRNCTEPTTLTALGDKYALTQHTMPTPHANVANANMLTILSQVNLVSGRKEATATTTIPTTAALQNTQRQQQQQQQISPSFLSERETFILEYEC